jgi:hypothetical protein
MATILVRRPSIRQRKALSLVRGSRLAGLPAIAIRAKADLRPPLARRYLVASSAVLAD